MAWPCGSWRHKQQLNLCTCVCTVQDLSVSLPPCFSHSHKLFPLFLDLNADTLIFVAADELHSNRSPSMHEFSISSLILLMQNIELRICAFPFLELANIRHFATTHTVTIEDGMQFCDKAKTTSAILHFTENMPEAIKNDTCLLASTESAVSVVTVAMRSIDCRHRSTLHKI